MAARWNRMMTAVVAAAIALPEVVFGLGAGTASADSSGTILPMTSTLRRCDNSPASFVPPTGVARTTAVIRREGAQVVGDIDIATGQANSRYDVRLIQTPRPASSTCSPGDPGVVAGSLFTDEAGVARITLRDQIRPGATGAWVYISLPSEFSQTPEEFYTSDFIAPI